MPSRHIVDWCARNPVEWGDWRARAYWVRGGWGDKAGVTPTPAMEEFMACLQDKQQLFTQREYRDWCFARWEPWVKQLDKKKRLGVAWKLGRNFYPSAIDSLHVWAMLAETGMWNTCVVDTAQDATGAADITVSRGERNTHIALLAGTRRAQSDRDYKLEFRSQEQVRCVEILLNMDSPQEPGNKRWYTREQVMCALLGPEWTDNTEPKAIRASVQLSLLPEGRQQWMSHAPH